MKTAAPWGAFILVGIGGFAGSVVRYGLSVAAQRLAIEWPAGTLAANVIGCLIIGALTELAGRGGVSPEARLALAVGFCGGLTTLSSMIYELAAMLRTGGYLHAALYTAGTLLLSMAAFAAGVLTMRFLIKLGSGLWN